MKWGDIEWITIRNSGAMKEMPLTEESTMSPECRQLLKNLIIKLARVNTEYYRTERRLQDFPLGYGELQIDTTLLPAFRNLTRLVFLQCPVRRRVKKQDRPGRVDYWVDYEKTVFVFEVKHASLLLRSKGLKSDMKRDWKDAIQKLRNIKDQKQIWYLGWPRRKLIKLCLLLVPVENRSQNKKELKLRVKEVKTKVDELMTRLDSDLKQLKEGPTWVACWVIPSDMQEGWPFEDDEGKHFWNYPAVLVFGRVTETWKKVDDDWQRCE